MRVCVLSVVKLRGDKAALDVLCQLFSLCHRALHTPAAFGQHYFRTIRRKKLSAFDAHCFGHSENDLVALVSRYCRKSYSRIPAGRLNDDRALAQRSLCLSRLYHAKRRAVLNASRRIEVFELA